MIRLEVPVFGHAYGALAVRRGASRLELNRDGSYGIEDMAFVDP